MLFRRRRYIVNAGMQMRYTLAFICIALIGQVCAVVAFNVMAMKKIDEVMWSTHIDVKTTGELLHPLFIQVNVVAFVFILFLLILAGTWMIKKVTGPMYRMSKDLNKFSQGDMSAHIELREKDEFQDVAAQLNDMMKRLRGELVAIGEQYQSVSISLSNLEDAVTSGDTSQLKGLLKNLSELETHLEKFQV
jgi:methyl-accepting chemotaxis protein